MLQDTDASANDQFWGLQNSGGDFNILTCNDDRASGFVTPMTIDSVGRVFKPNQPSFIARVLMVIILILVQFHFLLLTKI